MACSDLDTFNKVVYTKDTSKVVVANVHNDAGNVQNVNFALTLHNEVEKTSHTTSRTKAMKPLET